MGMDVYGKAPVSKAGAYFRNNIWWWRPLWTYCQWLAPELIPEDNLGHFNDGWGLDEEGARALAKLLREELNSGRCQAFAESYKRDLEALPREPCDLCNGTGIRRDELGLEQGFPERLNPHTGKKGWCNGCNGKGDKPPFALNYPFTAENVARFAAFLEASGGFEIW